MNRKTSHTIRIATRQSPLALWQAQFVADSLIKHWPHITVKLVPMTTSGDKFLSDKLLSIGGKGLFVKELEEALLQHRADIAVHSMKDVPFSCPPGLTIAAICERDNPYDAFVSKQYPSLQALPNQAKIGTSSLRRQSQLLAYRPDLQVIPLRGNVQTRIAALDTQALDAIILAVAGLHRLNITEPTQQIIAEDIMLPACGQGAIGIECRHDDDTIQTLLSPLNHPATVHCVRAERHINGLLGGHCHVPVAIYSQFIDPETIKIQAKVASIDGKIIIEGSQTGPGEQIMQLADNCVQALLDKGAKTLLNLASH